jgi:hypothetical protein
MMTKEIWRKVLKEIKSGFSLMILDIKNFGVNGPVHFASCPNCGNKRRTYRLKEADKGRLWNPYREEYVVGYKYDEGTYDYYFLCQNCQHVWGKYKPEPSEPLP